jgi:hypothetical protein
LVALLVPALVTSMDAIRIKNTGKHIPEETIKYKGLPKKALYEPKVQQL